MLEKICTDFETSKKLKELGVDLLSKSEEFLAYECGGKKNSVYLYHYTEMCNGIVKAYTLETLINVLPATISLPEDNQVYHFNLEKAGFCYELDNVDADDYNFVYDSEQHNNENYATLGAQLLIRLLEDEIITVNEVNNAG